MKFLPAECQSVQAYPFKTTEGERATMICLSLLQALEQNKERERDIGRERLALFYPACVGFIISQKEKHSTDNESTIG